jgi:hypothetical protein
MIIGVAYGGETAQFALDPGKLLAHWSGPPRDGATTVGSQTRAALEAPLGFPPLARSVVPGDRVVIPTDPSLPDASEVLGALCEILLASGVEAQDITVLATGTTPPHGPWHLPPGVRIEAHDPEDPSGLAYLATTSSGRRIYVDRRATDADVVVPVGVLGYGSRERYHGPWSEVFPGLADSRTRGEPGRPSAPRGEPPAGLGESAEVSWLLGSQFHVGLAVGLSGVVGVIAGHQDEVLRRGAEAIDASWSVRAETPAELVVAGIGVPWKPTTLEDLAAGLGTAARLARVNGKVLALTDLAEIGPARTLRRLAELDDPRQGLGALRGLHRERDYPAAQRIVSALARADLYLCSRLEPELVEAIGMIPLDHPQEARRLLELCDSCLAIHPAERMRVVPEDDNGTPEAPRSPRRGADDDY